MAALVALALTVGLADSLNPSTVLPALYLSTRSNPLRHVILFTVGAFSAYLVGGIVLVFGPGRAIRSALPRPGAAATGLIELGVGTVLAVVAVALWACRDRLAKYFARSTVKTGRSSMLLGGSIMTLELPTALPYFVVIAAIVASGRSVADQLVLIALFNVAFITPLVLIAVTLHLMTDTGLGTSIVSVLSLIDEPLRCCRPSFSSQR